MPEELSRSDSLLTALSPLVSFYSTGWHTVSVSTRLPVASTGSEVQTCFSEVAVCGVTQAAAMSENGNTKTRLYTDDLLLFVSARHH